MILFTTFWGSNIRVFCNKKTVYRCSCLILNIHTHTLDNYQVTNEKYVKQIGNVTFRFASNVISGKLANNSSMGILSVPIHVKSMGLRSTKF